MSRSKQSFTLFINKCVHFRKNDSNVMLARQIRHHYDFDCSNSLEELLSIFHNNDEQTEAT
ncbi:hypothetical protein BLA29_015029, partial [Euroglyphus maynei]